MRIPKSICAIASCCDSESARFAMSAVLFGRRNKKPFAVATDGRRMIHATWDEEQLLEFPNENAGRITSLLVHGKDVKELASLCNGSKVADKKRVYLDESVAENVTASFTDKDIHREIESKPIEGRFPQWQDIIEDDKAKPVASVRMAGTLLLSTLKAVVSALECEGAQGVLLEVMQAGDSTPNRIRISGEQNGKTVVAVQMGVDVA
jgi:hypothetical protein